MKKNVLPLFLLKQGLIIWQEQKIHNIILNEQKNHQNYNKLVYIFIFHKKKKRIKNKEYTKIKEKKIYKNRIKKKKLLCCCKMILFFSFKKQNKKI